MKPSDVSAGQSIKDLAAAQLARQRTGPLLDEEAAAFATWIKADAAHAAEWSRYGRIWDQLDDVRDDPRILALREQARNRVARRRVWKVIAAAAAVVSISVGITWIPQTPARVRPTQLAGDRPRSTYHPAPVLPVPEASTIRVASTAPGERSLLFLPDGSRVTLNSSSAVRTEYSQAERRVTLVWGQAYFEVAKDSTRPFAVVAGARRIVALGTAFDVRLDDSRLNVSLANGKVRVVSRDGVSPVAGTPARNVELHAGSALTVKPDGAEEVAAVDPAHVAAWRADKLTYLIFDEERLANVVSEMNRNSHDKLVIADRALQDRTVSGVFESSAARVVAHALEAYGLARAHETSPGVIVLTLP